MKYLFVLLLVLRATHGYADDFWGTLGRDPSWNAGLNGLNQMARPPARPAPQQYHPVPNTNPWANQPPPQPVCEYIPVRDAYGNIRTVKICN